MKTIYSVFVVATALCASLEAAGILYNLRDQSQTAAIESGAYTVDGVLLSLSAVDGTLNQTSGSFGINHSGAGDEPAQLDGVAGAETLLFSFDIAGTLNALDLSSFGSGDTFDLKKGGVSGVTILNLVDQGNSTIYTVNESFLAGEVFALTFTAGVVEGGGASLDTISITAVPEPCSTFLLGMGGLGLLFRRKRTHRIEPLSGV